jgi:hypothetical protein
MLRIIISLLLSATVSTMAFGQVYDLKQIMDIGTELGEGGFRWDLRSSTVNLSEE